MRPIALLLFLTVLTPAIRAGEVDAPERLLETLVRQAVEGPEIDEPSPTSLVGKLLRSEPARLRETLKQHWAERHLYSWDAARALEEIAPSTAPAIPISAGIRLGCKSGVSSLTKVMAMAVTVCAATPMKKRRRSE